MPDRPRPDRGSGIQVLQPFFWMVHLWRRSFAPIKLDIEHSEMHEAQRS